MSDKNDNHISNNPYGWVTDDVFLEFLKERKVSMICELCGSENTWHIATGSDDGYIPRIPAMPNSQAGYALTGDTYQLPVVNCTCFMCGNVRLHSLLAVKIWKQSGGGQ